VTRRTFAAACVLGLTMILPTRTTVFFDDFSGDTIDRAKWTVRVSDGSVNDEQQAYIDSSATLHVAHGAEAEGAANGALVITPRFMPGVTNRKGERFDFISGRLDTRGKVEFMHGTVAARMKLPIGAGLWPAFWILGTGRWPDTGEIDVMENIGEGDWVSAALHGPKYFGNTPLVNRYYFRNGSDASAWHVYSVDWSSGELVFRVDGDVAYRVTRAMVEHHGPWAFDNNKFLILNLALGGGYPASANSAKQPYFGLPQTTVDDIKAGRVRVLVDWVRVTRE
jgi:beta-glucanase (GH16 family)